MSLLPARCTALLALTIAASAACATAPPRTVSARTAFADADSAVTVAIASGVTHTFVSDRRGPWAIHIIEVDAGKCEPVLEVRKGGSALSERATTSSLSSGALAAVNADFFMLPGGTPVGAHVTGSVPLIGPTDRPVFAVTPGGWRIGTARIDGHARVGGDSASIAQLNRPAASFSAYRGTTEGLTLFTAWVGGTVPADSAARRLTMRLLRGNEASGSGIVLSSDSAVAPTPMQRGSAVLIAHGQARDWARRRADGDTVWWNVRVVVDAPAALRASEMVGGFPELLRGGRDVLPEQTIAAGFGPRRHPRTAIGWTADNRLLLVVVDGRQPPYSDGMSLDEMVWLFRRLGASDALNLDGGGSTALVVNGIVTNRPSDREGERAVGNALALAGCR